MALPPTLSGCDQDFGSAGGGDIVTFHGSRLAGAAVFVDLEPATVIRSTDAYVRFVVPPCQDDSVRGLSLPSSVTVSTSGGSAISAGVARNMLWYLPTYRMAGAAVYSAQRITAVNGLVASVTDLSGNGCHLSPVTTGPEAVQSGVTGFKWPYWQHHGFATDNRLHNTSFPVVPGGSGVVVVAGSLDSSASQGYIFRLGATGGDSVTTVYAPGAVAAINQYAGTPANQVPVTLLQDMSVISTFYAPGGKQVRDGAVVSSAGDPGSGTATAGLVVGGEAVTGGGRCTTILGAFDSSLSIRIRSTRSIRPILRRTWPLDGRRGWL